MASTSKTTCISSAVARFFTFVLIFSFVGYASGSCAQYGHSCWGGHGKRSFDDRGSNEPRRFGLPNGAGREPWILSRLGTNQGTNQAPSAVTDKYHIRWSGVYEPKTFRTRRFNRVQLPISGINNDRFSNRKNNDETDAIAAEILLIPQKASGNEIKQPSNLQLLNILDNDEKNLK